MTAAAQVTPRDSGVLAVSGALTFDTVPDVYPGSVEWIAQAGSAITVDLVEVQKADSAGLALLLEWLHRARAAGRELRFVNVPEQVRSLVQVSGLNRALDI